MCSPAETCLVGNTKIKEVPLQKAARIGPKHRVKTTHTDGKRRRSNGDVSYSGLRPHILHRQRKAAH